MPLSDLMDIIPDRPGRRRRVREQLPGGEGRLLGLVDPVGHLLRHGAPGAVHVDFPVSLHQVCGGGRAQDGELPSGRERE